MLKQDTTEAEDQMPDVMPVPPYLHHKGVYDVLLGQQPVFHLFLIHERGQVELRQVLVQEPVYSGDVS